MAVLELPRALTLPSRARVTLALRRPPTGAPAEPAAGAPRFADVVDVLTREVTVSKGGDAIDALDLSLADFHVLRAVLTKARLVHEDEVELDCHNCGEILVTKPCERLELGPWIDGEIDDPELDRTLPLDEPIDTAPIPLGRVREARTVTFAPRTVREAKPLFAALSKDPIDIDAQFVEAMGIRALGSVTDPRTIAHALSECDERAFAAVTEAFIDVHYSLRLASDLICPKCKAKNTTLAPALREFELGVADEDEDDGDEDDGKETLERRRAAESDDEWPPLPPIDDFVELAHTIAEPLIADMPGDKPMLVVEDGIPAVDDGGVPLLGSYVPPPPTDLPVPTGPPTVTVYYRTFQALEREGPYDWRGELASTIEHELEHHLYFLGGDDPMDEEERAEIDRDAVRIVGRGETTRRAIHDFGRSVSDFFRRAWPLVLIGALVLGITIAEARCSGP